MYIADLDIGDPIEGFYLLQSAAARTTTNGKPYMTVTLADCTGTIDGQVWDYSGPITPADVGNAVKVKGLVTEYRGNRQVTVDRIRLSFKDDVFNVDDLVPSAPIDAEECWRELLGYVGSIEDEEYRAVVTAIFDRYGERFRRIPAAKSVHHAFVHGLLMHTIFMARTADFMSGLYGGIIDRSLLMAGTLLHDVAKCDEFTLSPLGVVVDYSVSGQLLGHLTMGAELVADEAARLHMSAEKSLLLRHMILSHHGQPEHGAAVPPACIEAELLSYIDDMDSRMEIYRESFFETPPGQLSRRLFALDRRIYNHLPEEE